LVAYRGEMLFAQSLVEQEPQMQFEKKRKSKRATAFPNERRKHITSIVLVRLKLMKASQSAPHYCEIEIAKPYSW